MPVLVLDPQVEGSNPRHIFVPERLSFAQMRQPLPSTRDVLAIDGRGAERQRMAVVQPMLIKLQMGPKALHWKHQQRCELRPR